MAAYASDHLLFDKEAKHLLKALALSAIPPVTEKIKEVNVMWLTSSINNH